MKLDILVAGLVGGRQLGIYFLSRQLEEFDRSCSRFLECMRHSSAFELVQRVKSFVNSFMGTQGTSDTCSQLVKRFVGVRCFIVLISSWLLWNCAHYEFYLSCETFSSFAFLLFFPPLLPLPYLPFSSFASLSTFSSSSFLHLSFLLFQTPFFSPLFSLLPFLFSSPSILFPLFLLYSTHFLSITFLLLATRKCLS